MSSVVTAPLTVKCLSVLMIVLGFAEIIAGTVAHVVISSNDQIGVMWAGIPLIFVGVMPLIFTYKTKQEVGSMTRNSVFMFVIVSAGMIMEYAGYLDISIIKECGTYKEAYASEYTRLRCESKLIKAANEFQAKNLTSHPTDFCFCSNTLDGECFTYTIYDTYTCNSLPKIMKPRVTASVILLSIGTITLCIFINLLIYFTCRADSTNAHSNSGAVRAIRVVITHSFIPLSTSRLSTRSVVPYNAIVPINNTDDIENNNNSIIQNSNSNRNNMLTTAVVEAHAEIISHSFNSNSENTTPVYAAVAEVVSTHETATDQSICADSRRNAQQTQQAIERASSFSNENVHSDTSIEVRQPSHNLASVIPYK